MAFQNFAGKRRPSSDAYSRKSKGLFVVDDPDTGTGHFQIEDIFANFAPEFIPNSTTTVAGQPYIYDGLLNIAKEAYQGPWDSSKFVAMSVAEYFASLIDAFSAIGIFPYYGDVNDLNSDATADKKKFYFDARPSSASYKRVIFYSTASAAWRTLPNNGTVDTVSNFLGIQKNSAARVLFDIFVGKVVKPSSYAGGLGVIQQDATADKTKVYFSTTSGNRLMYWEESTSCWMFAGEYTYFDCLYFIDLCNRFLGVIPYNGDITIIKADANADKTKKYLLNNGTIAVWSYVASDWVNSCTYENVEATIASIVGAWPYYGGGLSSINVDQNVDTTKTYFVVTPGSNNLKKLVYDSVNESWVYGDFINKDVNESLKALIGGIVGAVPYFGGQSMIAVDTTADKTKTYFVALSTSVNFLKTMYWDASNSTWMYGDKVTSLQSENTPMNIENEKVRQYLFNTSYDGGDYSYTNVLDYAANDLDKPNAFNVQWEFSGTCDSFNVKVSLDGSFDSFKTYTYSVANTARSFTIQCLDPSKVAGVKVTAVSGGTETVVVSKAIHAEGQVRMIAVDGIRNVRDIGGWSALDGKKIKYGKFFRGSAIDESGSTISSAGKVVLYNLLGVRSEIDLRSTTSPTTSALGPDAIKYSIAGYSYLNGFNDTSAAYTVLSRVFTEVAAGHNIYMHCSGGCDRTAFYVCMMEGLLGLSETDITKDFELSSFMDKAYSNNYRRYRSMGTEYSNRDWAGLVALIKNETGDTLADKFYNYFVRIGFTTSQISDFRNAMLE